MMFSPAVTTTLEARCKDKHPDTLEVKPRASAIAIIGAGFSGTLLALHLLRRCPDTVTIHLIERHKRFGRGLAYSTGNANHLLNVPAGRMSAFSSEPNHFVDWLCESGPEDCREGGHTRFVRRAVFGDYIRFLLNAELKRAGRDRLVLSRGAVVGMKTTSEQTVLTLDRGQKVEADVAVLAVGNFPPEAPSVSDPSFYDRTSYKADPWASSTLADLDPEASVFLIGTGLTMVDTVVSLLDRGHKGPIHAVSRRGLLPHQHSTAKSALLLDQPLPTSISALTRFLRSEVDAVEAAGGDWRSVIDGVRPALQDLWQSMSAGNRARFVRHLRRWWDIHRHRMPGSVAERIEAARASGQLRIHAARITDFKTVEPDAVDGVEAFCSARHDGQEFSLRVARIINCSGPGCDYDRITDPLIRCLLEDGLIRPDPLRLGLDVTPTCAVLNKKGEISRRLYAVGPTTKSAFWEMTSVPDLRRQCELVAGQIAVTMAAVMDQKRARLPII